MRTSESTGSRVAYDLQSVSLGEVSVSQTTTDKNLPLAIQDSLHNKTFPTLDLPITDCVPATLKALPRIPGPIDTMLHTNDF